ncbi:MAG: hypothetical protein F6K39_21140 [Okeania sp. SIO3B3]|nr:hypothetical protein [Okeania sp. SIO3B3]
MLSSPLLPYSPTPYSPTPPLLLNRSQMGSICCGAKRHVQIDREKENSALLASL